MEATDSPTPGGAAISKRSWERNTQGLQAHAQHRKEATVARVNTAIDTLLRTRAPVNFNTVAQEARVTKAYLYKYPQVRDRIAALREQQQGYQLRQQTTRAQAKTEASKDVVILAKDRQIRELEQEIRRLKEEIQQLKKDLQVAHGKLYDRL